MKQKKQNREVILRKEAQAAGLTRYFTGKPCKRGGVAERITRNGFCMCRECKDFRNALDSEARRKRGKKALELEAEWRKSNKDRVKATQARFDERHPGRKAEIHKSWRTRNREKHNARGAAWKAENIDAVSASRHLRRARKLNATPVWYGEFDEFAMQEAADLAKRREVATGVKWHVDHMIPLQAKNACGLHCAANLQVIPARMNTAKCNKLQLTEPGEWLRNL